MLKTLCALMMASVVAAEQTLDVHDADYCADDDKMEVDGCCSDLSYFYCDDFYTSTNTGTCWNGKDKYTCICSKDDLFCNDSWGDDWDSEWDDFDAEW